MYYLVKQLLDCSGEPESIQHAALVHRFFHRSLHPIGMVVKCVDYVCVLSGETTPEDLANYKGKPPAIVVETFDKVDIQ
jgi:hypothetical protein